MEPLHVQSDRRHWLQTVSAGFGYVAFAGLSHLQAASQDRGSGNPLQARAPHFPAKAKRVIFLCMQGGPSHIDTFDYKPELIAGNGKSGRFARRLLSPQWKFNQHGESGLWISELFPQLSRHADDLCLIRSMYCDQPVHPRAMTQMHTGNVQFVRPSLGAWTLYGLGTENESLPGFIAMNPPGGGGQNIGSAFLPAIYQGTTIGGVGGRGPAAFMARRGGGEQMPDLKNTRVDPKAQRRQLDLVQSLNRRQLKSDLPEQEVEGAIQSLELAFRMQDSLPELMDLGKETENTKAMYGLDNPATQNFGRQCLLARKFVEAGVRFVEVSHGNWDHHTRLSALLPEKCEEVDKPIAGLLEDLRQRGLLDDTLVIWGGEFGRTPDGQNGDGRDHNNKGYTIWMAGGGVRGGFSHGETDPLGYEAVENRCHVHDWHATILHLLGLDHTQLTYKYAGRDFRLTDVYGNVVHEIIS